MRAAPTRSTSCSAHLGREELLQREELDEKDLCHWRAEIERLKRVLSVKMLTLGSLGSSDDPFWHGFYMDSHNRSLNKLQELQLVAAGLELRLSATRAALGGWPWLC